MKKGSCERYLHMQGMQFPAPSFHQLALNETLIKTTLMIQPDPWRLIPVLDAVNMNPGSQTDLPFASITDQLPTITQSPRILLIQKPVILNCSHKPFPLNPTCNQTLLVFWRKTP